MGTLSDYYQHNINTDAPENFENSWQRNQGGCEKYAAGYFKGADLVDLIFLPPKNSSATVDQEKKIPGFHQVFFVELESNPVQTRKQYAFSMLSLDLVFERQLAQDLDWHLNSGYFIREAE